MTSFCSVLAVGCAGAFFFMATWLARGSVSLGFLDRPLVIGLLTGCCTGQWDVAVPLGIVLELLWLDVIPLGSVIPPAGSLVYFLVFSVYLLFPLHVPGQLAMPFFLALGCAYLSPRLERRQRAQANSLVESLLQRGGKQFPSRLIYASFGIRALQQGVLYLVCFAVLYAMTFLLTLLPAGVPHIADLHWEMLYGIGGMGALLTLRTRRACATFGACLLLLAACTWMLPLFPLP